MKQKVTLQMFMDEFKQMDRDYFSYEGYESIYNFLEECFWLSDENFEFDVIAICCDFSEYEDLEEYNDDCGTEFRDIEELAQETLVLQTEKGSLIVQDY